MNETTTQPTSSKAVHRIKFLDALRGIAIFFIFTANVAFLSGNIFLGTIDPFSWAVLPIDDVFNGIIHTLVDGKFYTIFSLLFGIGFTIQYENLKKRNLPFKPFFRRRMCWLLVIGGIHLSLIWMGDILTLYAILGFLLLNFVETDQKKLLKWAVILILFPILNTIIIELLGLNYAGIFALISQEVVFFFGLPSKEFFGLNLVDFKFEFSNENWLKFFQINISNMFLRIYGILEEGRPFKVLGIFLIGIWSGRKIIHEDLINNLVFLKKIALYGILIGLPISIVRSYLEFSGFGGDMSPLFITIAYALGTVPLALGYAALLAIAFQKNALRFRWFETVGKMALTNYILQSTLSILFFYSIGLGFFSKFGFTFLMIYCCIFFVFQIIFSKLWLQKFKQGPLEWLWRKFTYKGI